MELTKHELSSFEQGKLIVSDEQMAVCYLIASQGLNGNFPSFTLKTSISEVFIYSGMNQETLRRTVAKFTILLLDQQDDEEITSKEVLYPKLIDAYNVFTELTTDQVYTIANKAFTEDNKKIGLATNEVYKEKQKKYAINSKVRDKVIKDKVTFLFKSLNKIFNDSTKSKRQAINKVASEMEVDVKRVQLLWNKDAYLKTIK